MVRFRRYEGTRARRYEDRLFAENWTCEQFSYTVPLYRRTPELSHINFKVKDFDYFLLNTNYHELSINGCTLQLYEKLYGNYMLKKILLTFTIIIRSSV